MKEALIYNLITVPATLLVAELLLKWGVFKRVGAWLFPLRRMLLGLGIFGFIAGVAWMMLTPQDPPSAPGWSSAKTIQMLLAACFTNAMVLWLLATGFAHRERPVRLRLVDGFGDDFGWLPLRGFWRHLGAFLTTSFVYTTVRQLINLT
jgi:hypothetical protein